MPFTTVGSSWKTRCKRAAAAAFTLVVLSAVAVVGLTVLASEVLASWTGPGNAEQALATRGAFEGLLTFDAPASTVARLEAEAKEAQEGKDLASDIFVVKDWKFTASLADYFHTAWNAYVFGIRITAIEGFLDSFGPALPQPLIDQVFTRLYNLARVIEGISSVFLPPGLRPPPLPPASPFL